MTILQAFRLGTRKAFGTPRLLLVLYLFNLLLAFPAAYAFRAVLLAEFGNSLAPEQFLGGFDFTLYSDFMKHHGNAVDAVLRLIVPLVVLGLLVGPFLGGGTIAAIRAKGESFSVRRFFWEGGLYYFRIFRLSIIFSLLAVLLFAAASLVLGGIVSAIDDEAVSEISPFVAAVAGIGITGLLLAFLLVASEFARIAVVAGNSRRMLGAAITGLGFALRNIGVVAGLQILFALLAGAMIALYWVIEGLLPMNSGPMIVLVFLLQQLFIIVRILLRTATFASENLLYEDRKPNSVTFYGWDDSPAPVIG
jgi:hypothetical protein